MAPAASPSTRPPTPTPTAGSGPGRTRSPSCSSLEPRPEGRMKRPDARSTSHRVILEPGLPPLVGSTGRGAWYTALRLPALHALSMGLPERRRSGRVLEDLLEPGEVEVALDTDDTWPSRSEEHTS